MKYQGKTNSYSKGLLGDASTPHVVGVVGEIAFQDWINSAVGKTITSINDSLAADNGSDFEIAGISIDVKTSTKPGTRLLVTRVNAKRIRGVSADLYVKCHWKPGTRVVLLEGFVEKRELKRFEQGIAEGQFNLKADPCDFRPMNRIASRIRAQLMAEALA